MKNLIWVSPESSNDFNVNTTLGGGIYLRRSMFEHAWAEKWHVHYLSCKKNGYLWDKQKPHPKITDGYHITEVIKEALNKYTKIAKEKGKKVGNSETRWILIKTIDYVLKHAKFPKAEMVWIEYIDPGFPAIVLCMATMIHYAREGTAIFVRDPDLKFRYTTTLKPLHDKRRDTMYEERIQRYISDEHLEDIRGNIVLLYQFECGWATDPFCRGYETFPPAYDWTKNLPIDFDKKKNRFAYVGNVNGREDMFERYYGRLEYPAHIWGRWPQPFIDRMDEVNPRVQFKGIVPYEDLSQVLNRAKISMHVTRKDYAKLEQITDRSIEVAQAGTILICPIEAKGGMFMTLPELNFEDAKDMNSLAQDIMDMDSTTYSSIVMQQREYLHDQLCPDVLWEKLLRMKEQYFS